MNLRSPYLSFGIHHHSKQFFLVMSNEMKTNNSAARLFSLPLRPQSSATYV